MYCTRVLAFVAVLVGLAQSFPWDIVVGVEKRLEFYYNGAVTHAEVIPTASKIYSITYDPVHDRVLFLDYHNSKTSLASFDLATRKIEPLVTNTSIIANSVMSITYDPVTQLLFWAEGYLKIYSLSLKPESSYKAVGANLLFTLEHNCWEVIVDSCGGFIYWATDYEIERAAFDGSKREVLLYGAVTARRCLTIDHQTQTIYWAEEITMNEHSIESIDLNGKNRKTFNLIGTEYAATDVVVTKDFIYWKSYNQRSILRQPKNQQRAVGPVVYSNSSTDLWNHRLTAANYTIKEQTLGIQNCEALKNTTADQNHKNSTECYGSTCHNYCFQGNCSMSAEGQPKCSCEAGYSGERCEVNVCYKHCLHGGVCSLNEEDEPFCQCTAEYEGERCDVTTSLTHGVHAEDATQEMLRDLRREAKKVITEELKRALHFFSDKIDEYEAKI